MLMPILDYFGETQVCGENATNTGHLTKTAKVEAGSQLGMRAFAYYAKADEEKVLNHQVSACQPSHLARLCRYWT